MTLKNSVLADNVTCKYVQRDRILKLLKEHILTNIVKVGDKYYQQIQGIPQGSVLSALLCSLYYGDMEHKHLNSIPTSNGKGLLLRFIDDFLYITTSIQHAETFVKKMHVGFPDYGSFVNADKTMVNFDIQIEGKPLYKSSKKWQVFGTEMQDYFPWCGFLINTKTLEVQRDYTRYFFNCITIPFATHPFYDQLIYRFLTKQISVTH